MMSSRQLNTACWQAELAVTQRSALEDKIRLQGQQEEMQLIEHERSQQETAAQQAKLSQLRTHQLLADNAREQVLE